MAVTVRTIRANHVTALCGKLYCVRCESGRSVQETGGGGRNEQLKTVHRSTEACAEDACLVRELKAYVT
jgi:hypothetical protein